MVQSPRVDHSAGRTREGKSGRRQTCALVAVAAVIILAVLAARDRRSAPPDPDALFREGLTAIEEGRRNDAVRIARSLSSLPAGRSYAIVLSGVLQLQQGDAAGALHFFSKARPEGALRHPLLLYTAQALYGVGKLHEAGRLLRECVSEEPDAAEPHRWLGAVYFDLGIRSQAVSELEAASRLAPGDHRPHRLLGLIYYDFQQYDAAARHYRRALELHDPKDQGDVVQELGRCLIELRAFEEARTLLRDADGNPALLALRAEAEFSLGNLEQAGRDVNRVLQLSPENVRCNLLQARLDLAGGKLERAIHHLQQARNAAPYDPAVRYQLMTALQEAGRETEAADELAALEVSTQLHSRYMQLAETAAREPENVTVRRELVALCRQLGEEAAAGAWERAAAACEEISANAQQTSMPAAAPENP